MKHVACIAAFVALASTPAFALKALPANKPVSVKKDVTAVCTGIGADTVSAWSGYPLKIVVAGKHGQYLAGATDVTISDRKKAVRLRCDNPLILVKLAPGRYRITAARQGETAKTAAWVLERSQGLAVLRFPHQGGAVSADYLKQLRDQANAQRTVRQATR